MIPTEPAADISELHLNFDESLPIVAWHDRIVDTLRSNPVVVIAGETGSGKTTQLPKMCLEIGRRSIAHTQPRRIAARTVAERIAEEVQVELGDLVGYQVRFTRQASRDTRLKVMTDGILLAEIAHDRDLRRYDTIIVDEAHERSLNIDFLLGYLKQLLQRRDDLLVIVTSATIDTERFAAHFAAPDGTPAPIISVSGRTFGVELRYRPLLEDGEADLMGAIVGAVEELSALGSGDILVFLSGEREIRDAAEALQSAQLRFTEILPLYARLSAAEQHRVFAAHPGRRVVLATNIAETSLTVPGIRYVVDAGTARISRYSARTKVQRLPIEPVSRASADQRAGRCGRVAPGVAVRLYSEEDYLGRPEFTEPEILRTNLASVILQMAAADLGDVVDFPFVEPPDNTQISDGMRLLEELGALKAPRDRGRLQLTRVGRRLAAVPVDPRMARMLLGADEHSCLREMLIIVSGLSIQDPRERPAEHKEKADALHRRFWAPLPATGDAAVDPADPPDPDGSDFLAWVRLWDYLRDAQRTRSGNAFRRLCRDEFLHFLRIREWQDLHGQLKQISKELGLHRNETAAPARQVHTAALTGLLSHVGLADLRQDAKAPPGRRRGRGLQEYLGARGTRFAINPGSSLARTQPPLVMAAEIVETSRLWARTLAAIDAAQVESVGSHVLKRSYSEPHWSMRSGSVQAYETVTLFGVPIVAGRRVGYGAVNPAEAREIFIRSALVEGQWRTRHQFFQHNAEVRAEAERLEERQRRRDLVVDDQVIFDFYANRIPATVTSASHFDAWWKQARAAEPNLLTLTLDDLLLAGQHDTAAYPAQWRVQGHDLDVSYRFDPGDEADGVTVTVPLTLLSQLRPAPFTWQVPGFRRELATELIKSLPKAVRRHFAPAGEYAGRALAWLAERPEADESLTDGLARALRALSGETVEGWRWDLVPDHLRPRFAVVGEGGLLAAGRDLETLQAELAPQVTRTLADAAADLAQPPSTTWTFGSLPDRLDLERHGHRLTAYPALVDRQTQVAVEVFDTPQRQAVEQRRGLRRLVLLNTPDPTRWVISRLSNTTKLALAHSPYPGVPDLLADVRLAAVGELVRRHQHAPVRDAEEFARLCDAVRQENPELMARMTDLVADVLRLHQQVLAALPPVGAVAPGAHADMTEQVGNLIFRGFVSATSYEHLVDLPRYLAAALQRIATVLAAPARDRLAAQVIARCEDAYAELAALAPPGPLPAAVEEVGWLVEELRVSLFAQTLRTKVAVSEKRVLNAIAAARAAL